MNKFLFPVLSLIAVIGLYFLVISPTWAEVKVLQTKEADFDKALSEAEEINKTILELQSTLTTISTEDLESLDLLLPQEVDSTQVINNIYGILDEYDVEVLKVGSVEPTPEPNSGEDVKQNKVLEYSVNFEIYATYGDFKKIMEDIEQNLQFSNLNKLTITADETESDRDLPSFDIGLIFYSLD